MKRFLSRMMCVTLVVLAGVVLADFAAAQEKVKQGSEVKYEKHGAPYFVNNTFEKDAAESFVVLKTQAEFDKVFGIGMVMGGPNPTINAKTFDSKIVVAVVKRGPMAHYTVDGVVKDGKKLLVQYAVKTDPPGSATFAVPLILTVPKADYSSVVFVENGQEVKELK